MFENPTIESEDSAEEDPKLRFETKLEHAKSLDDIAEAFGELAGGEERFESDGGFDMHVETTIQNIKDGKIDAMYDSRLKEAVSRVLAGSEGEQESLEEVSFEKRLAAAETIDDIVDAMKDEAEDGSFVLLDSRQKLPVGEVEKMIRGEGGYSQDSINDHKLQEAVTRVLGSRE